MKTLTLTALLVATFFTFSFSAEKGKTEKTDLTCCIKHAESKNSLNVKTLAECLKKHDKQNTKENTKTDDELFGPAED